MHVQQCMQAALVPLAVRPAHADVLIDVREHGGVACRSLRLVMQMAFSPACGAHAFALCVLVHGGVACCSLTFGCGSGQVQ